MGAGEVRRAVVELAQPARRPAAAQRLAALLGAEEVLVLLRDAVIGQMVPAPGFARTLPGGPAWRAFLAQCLQPGLHTHLVDLPRERPRRASALVGDGLALVVFGEAPPLAALEEIEEIVPLLAQALHGELEAALAREEARDARGLASKGETLALALESARSETARLNEALRQEHRRKDEFLAMLAHELRNPLAPLINCVALLRRRGPGDPQLERLGAIMARQSSHLARLVDDLLDISRVTRGTVELRCQELSLWEAVEHAVEMNRPILEAQGHALDLEPPPAPIVVWGDAVRVTQVVSNLVHNAAKYTPEGGRIAIRAGSAAGEAVLHVTDNGLGIAPEMLDSVFGLFTQIPTAMEAARGGLGIGLTLVKKLAELHGGSVSAQSGGLGKGSRFTVRLPLASVKQPARIDC